MLGGAATVVLSPATVVLSPATVVLQPHGGAEPSNGGAATTRWCCNHTVVLSPATVVLSPAYHASAHYSTQGISRYVLGWPEP